MADPKRETNSLLRHDRMVVANELRSALSSWSDRVIVPGVILIVLITLRASLFDRPFILAATAVAALAVVAGAGTARVVQRRLEFHAYDGAIAADALAEATRRRYILSVHAMACGIVASCALIGRPATVGLAVIGYLVGAGSCHMARRLMSRGDVARRPALLRSVGALLQSPIAGALAAMPIVLSLLLLGSIEPGPMAAFIGMVSAVAALLLTTLDAAVVRFMTVSGYPARRIVRIHARALSVFLLLTVLACLVLSRGLVAIVVGCVVLAALALMTARILAYRIHPKRTADTVVSICAAVACLAGVTMPMLLPFVVVAILWHLHRRSGSATWLLP